MASQRWFAVLFTILLTLQRSNSQVLEALLNLVAEGQQEFEQEPPDRKNLLSEYDFVIVGAGTAGCVIANRLSENPDWNVLLIEAGRPENYLMDMPLLANYLQFLDTNWKYKTMPSDKYCMGLDNAQCNWPRGKVMGGSSVLNYMIYTRGNRRDYDHWAAMGNEGWSYQDVLPYFKKVENFSIPEYRDSPYHGKDGYLSVNYAPYHTEIADAFIKASEQLGFNYTDYNGRNQVGVSRLQLSMRDGLRASSSRSYLHPIRDRPNLHVKKFTMVSKILIDSATKQANGVVFKSDGKTRSIRATKEVIVSAGAINSPQLLMLSGIGPKKHLTKIGIPVLQNLKVGYNLMDHIALGGLTFMINRPLSLITTKLITNENLINFFSHHKGPMTVPGGCEALVFTDFERPGDPDGYPEMELLFIAGSLVSDELLPKDFGISDEVFNSVYKPIANAETFMVFPMLLRPKSKGKVMLPSKYYQHKPYIYPNYFSDPYDMETIIKGTRLAINITMQPAMQKLDAHIHDIPLPQCSQFAFNSDAYLDCWSRHLTFTIYHQSGTCKMGPPTDKMAVVDPRLRVYGIKGLRVIDASIIPEIPAAHTNAPTFMIAEKGADMIKEDWGMKI